MDEGAEIQEPKISLTEALLIGFSLVVVSIINLIPLVGDFTSVVAGGLMFYYLRQKNLWGASTLITNGVGYAAGFFPIIQALPTELTAWIVTVWIDRHPALEAIAEKVGEATEGKGARATGAATEVGAAGKAAQDLAAGAKEKMASEMAPGGTQAEGSGTAQKTTTPTGEGGQEETEEELEKRRKEEEIERQMKSGAEISPEEEAQEQLFNPQENKFHEAEGPSLKKKLPPQERKAA
jgi:hypothetical protein